MKKLISLVLALAMVLMVGAALAGTIDVTNVLDGETYTAYKILNYKDNGETGEDRAVSYYLTAAEYTAIGSVLEAAGFHFTESADGAQYFVDNAKTFDAAAAAEYLAAHVADLGSALATATATGESGSATFSGLATGYYFVTSSAGSLCALHEDTDIATVVEKNTVPEEDKTQSTAADGTYADTTLDFNIGDTVYYQVEITDGTGTNSAITLTDTMSEGLTLNQDDITVLKDGSAVDAANYTITGKSAQGFTLTLLADYVATLDDGDVVVVKYNATINENAAIDSDTNTNTAKLEYSEQEQTDVVKLETYDFVVKKTDGTNFLDGAEFKLYNAETGGNEIKLSKDDTGYYKDANATEDLTIDINSADGCNVRGLAPGDYWLEEVVVPDGYNKLAARQQVTIATGATAAVEITVVNNAGTELPSTGGIGTTIFYVVGGILLIGAAIVLVARRKASN